MADQAGMNDTEAQVRFLTTCIWAFVVFVAVCCAQCESHRWHDSPIGTPTGGSVSAPDRK